MSAHFCAALPNFKIREIDIDDVIWKDDIVTLPPVIENGELLLPTGPGWGADVNEEFVRAHPAQSARESLVPGGGAAYPAWHEAADRRRSGCGRIRAAISRCWQSPGQWLSDGRLDGQRASKPISG